MTKEEAKKKLEFKKVYLESPSKSELVQRKLVELDFNIGSYKDNFHPYIYTYQKGGFCEYGNDLNIFYNSTNTQISADEIISLEINKNHDFKPYDKVLVRDKERHPWIPTFFSRQEENGYYNCCGATWAYCVPFDEKLINND